MDATLFADLYAPLPIRLRWMTLPKCSQWLRYMRSFLASPAAATCEARLMMRC
jgi:hypothetical protein